jgi:hypothetical protein
VRPKGDLQSSDGSRIMMDGMLTLDYDGRGVGAACPQLTMVPDPGRKMLRIRHSSPNVRFTDGTCWLRMAFSAF